MAIKLGEKILRDMYLGDKRISKAYLSEKLVFEADKPIFVEYIESTGTQYIDTNYIPTLDDEIIADLQHMATDSDYYGDRMFFGNQVKDSSLSCIFVEQYTPSFRWYTRFGTISSRSANATDIEKTERITITINKTRFSTSEGTSLTFSDLVELNQTPLMIFNQKSTSGANRTSKMKLWSFKVTRNGNTMMDLRPCIHPKTFEACMYDTVSHKYFYNQGEGSFIPAPRFVEYIESDSTAYIDTGVSGDNDNLEIDITFMAQKFVQHGAVYGNYIDEVTNTTRIIFTTNNSDLYSSINCSATSNTVVGTGSSILNKVINFYQSKFKITVNGADYPVYTRYEGTANNNNIVLFNRSLTVPITRDIGLRVYDFKISESGTLLRHLRPCLRGNTPCMYDMVSGTYFYNQGIGEFIPGCIL